MRPQVPHIEFADLDYRSYHAFSVPRFSVEELGKMLLYYRCASPVSFQRLCPSSCCVTPAENTVPKLCCSGIRFSRSEEPWR